MKNYLYILLIFFAGACSQTAQIDGELKNSYNIIPLPKSISPMEGKLVIDESLKIYAEDALKNEAEALSEVIVESGGPTLEIASASEFSGKGIVLSTNEGLTANEGYILKINSQSASVESSSSTGVFYGVMSIAQLITQTEGISFLPNCEIADEPRFAYRGMHLDVGRHFFPAEDIKKYIDYIAMHKMNKFHWHLTEDQGWRIEIKKYPKLAEISSKRAETLVGHGKNSDKKYDGTPYGGFYSQDEIRDIVAYAASKHITIIPEIEMPGHTQAVLAAYPELGCTGGPYKVAEEWGVKPDIFCTTDETFNFLEDVLTEVMDLFPSTYIHIGGDEAPKTRWEACPKCQQRMKEEGLQDEHELQSYFIKRIETFLNSKGRKLIGWDEILEGGLAPEATVMSWRGEKGGIEAAKQGHDVIMTPNSHCYFDHYQSRSKDEPLAIGGFLPLKKVYSYEPIPDQLSQEEAKYVLGAQANVWTEYMKTFDQVEYMIFPRMAALAEVVWSEKESRNYESFNTRLEKLFKIYDRNGYNSARHFFDLRLTEEFNSDQAKYEVILLTQLAETIHYTLDGSEVTASSPVFDSLLTIDTTCELKAQGFNGAEKVGNLLTKNYYLHKGVGKSIELVNEPNPSYKGKGAINLLNGLKGSGSHGDGEWLGFTPDPMIASIDLGEVTDINTISINFMESQASWIFLPEKLKVEISDDGENYQEIINITDCSDENVFEINQKAKIVKVSATPVQSLPSDHIGAGNPGWLFCDEIIIE